MIAHPCCLLGTAKLCNSTEHITLTLWCLLLWLPSMLEEHHFQPKNKLMHFFSLILEPAGTAQPRLPGQNCSIVLPQRLVAETVQEWASNKHFTTRLSCDIMKGFAGLMAWWSVYAHLPSLSSSPGRAYSACCPDTWQPHWIMPKLIVYKSWGGLSLLEPVCCKKQQKNFLTCYWFAE